MYKDITGIILSGGKSSRMGVNKSLLKIGDALIVEIISDLMKSSFETNLLSANSAEEYAFLQLPTVKDEIMNCGPLGGIYSAMSKSATKKNFIISCDVPFMNKEMIEYLVNYKSNSQILICNAAGFLQPLIGLYDKSLLPLIEEILSQIDSLNDEKKKHHSLHELIKEANTEIIDPTSLPFYSNQLFFNINNKGDYERILKGL